MIFFPYWEWTQKIISSPWIILPAVLCYCGLLFSNLNKEDIKVFKNASPKSLAKIMQKPWAASLFWAYAGAFDLFIGRWIFLSSQENNISHLYIAPILFISIFFGPVGFLLFGIVIFFSS